MGPEDWIGGVGAVAAWLARLALRALVCLWWWGPRPDDAYEPGSYGDRKVGRTYRRAWRSGQVLGWSLITLVVLGVGVIVVAT